MPLDIRLRPVLESDLPAFFEHQRDPEAARLAAFASRDEAAFHAHWQKLLADDSRIKLAIEVDGALAGNLVCFGPPEERQVGYWIGRGFWGRGVASRALALFLEHIPHRPLFAFVAEHNRASIRVLEKGGFRPSDSPEPGEVLMVLA